MSTSSSITPSMAITGWKRYLLLLSPLAVIGFSSLAARLVGHRLGDWSWVPVFLVYWLLLACCLAWSVGWQKYKRWLQPSQGRWGWRLLGFLTLALFLPTFLLNWRALHSLPVVLPWLVLAVLNPWLEEGYWRGLFREATIGWPTWLAILYSTFWFGLSHPLILGVNVPALHGLPGLIGTLFTGLIWALSYWKTRSLRWPIFTHILADLFSVSVLVFTGKAILPG